MPCVTIKRKAAKTAEAASHLMQRVQQKTTDLLDAADRVLVVYEQSGANIYYEGTEPLKSSAGPN